MVCGLFLPASPGGLASSVGVLISCCWVTFTDRVGCLLLCASICPGLAPRCSIAAIVICCSFRCYCAISASCVRVCEVIVIPAGLSVWKAASQLPSDCGRALLLAGL